MLIDGITTPSGVQLDTAELDKVDSVAAGNTQEQLDAKFDKSGGAITGNVTIGGDITATHAGRFDVASAVGQNLRLAAGTTFLQVGNGDAILLQTNGAERMNIAANGDVFIGAYSAVGASKGRRFAGGNSYSSTDNSGGAAHHYFVNPNGVVGSIVTNGSATLFNTSSDYRLKENVLEITDGIDRVKLLKPSKFNFIADATKTVDGFIAHEAQAVVPEAVYGVKDAVEMQAIDQSKIVPLLTAALKEAIDKIEDLETRLIALETV